MSFRPLAAFLLTFLLAACNARNSVELDAKKYPAIDFTGMTAAKIRFAKAKQVLVGNCAECHNTFSTNLEATYLTSTTPKGGDALLSPGSLQKSAVYRVLRYAGNTDYMPPPPTPPLQDSEIEVLRNWILGYGQP